MERVAPRHLVDLAGLDRSWTLALFEQAELLRGLRKARNAPHPLEDGRSENCLTPVVWRGRVA